MRYPSLGLILLAACEHEPPTSCDQVDGGGAPAFHGGVGQSLEDTCGGCHYTEPAGLLLVDSERTYQVLLDEPSTQVPGMMRIEPGSLEDSYLWHKLRGTHQNVGGEGDPMPPAGSEGNGDDPELRDEEIDAIAAWICGGAAW